MSDNKFDPAKLKKLNNPQRLQDIPVQALVEDIDVKKNGTFVDLGAGTAFFSIAFWQAAQAEKIYACDISSIMLDWVQEHVVPFYPAIQPVQSEETCIPLQDSLADLVFMIHLHHELDNPIQTLKEAYRLLKPGGTVLVIDWKKEEMKEGPPVHIRCLPEEVAVQMKQAGFGKIAQSTDLERHFWVSGKK